MSSRRDHAEAHLKTHRSMSGMRADGDYSSAPEGSTIAGMPGAASSQLGGSPGIRGDRKRDDADTGAVGAAAAGGIAASAGNVPVRSMAPSSAPVGGAGSGESYSMGTSGMPISSISPSSPYA